MNRRRFLALLTGSGVAAGVTASAGLDWSHFVSWLTRNPRWSFPTDVHPLYTPASQIIPADEMFPELGQLMTIYYDRKALNLLERNFTLELADQKVEAQRFGYVYKPVLRTKQGKLVVV